MDHWREGPRRVRPGAEYEEMDAVARPVAVHQLSARVFDIRGDALGDGEPRRLADGSAGFRWRGDPAHGAELEP